MSLKQRAQRLKSDVPAVFTALKKRETPWYAKAVAAITVVYALSPIDLIPDFIPVLGYLDDLIILPALAALAIKLIPADIMAQCRRDAEGLWQNGKPKKWYYALPIILFYIAVILIIVSAVIRHK